MRERRNAMDEHYNKVDMPFYREMIEPLLPDAVLDFHTHLWKREQWKELPWTA